MAGYGGCTGFLAHWPSSLLTQMNGTPRDAAEPAPVWERPWSLEEIRKGSQSWSLASDAGVSGAAGTERGTGGVLNGAWDV